MQKIKDSGQRTEYLTGFVRDMHEGKGRFDLLPWGAIWELVKSGETLDIPARLEPSKALTALQQLQKMDELFKTAADAAKLAPTPEEVERIEEGEKILEKAEGTIKGPLEVKICEHMACPENADGACRKGHTTQCAGFIDPQIFD